MSVFEHLEELRRRLFIALAALLAATAVSFGFAGRVLAFLERPLGGLPLHYLHPLEPLFALVKIAVATGLVFASPVILYQAIAFVLPALTERERRLMFAYLPTAVLLFVAGLAFGFFVFVPLVIGTMLRFSGPGLQAMLTIGQYTSFLLSFMLPFGVVFELPVVVVLLVKLGVLTPAALAAGRKWAVLVAALVAAIFAPPDPVTPVIMAAPIYALYEISLWVARLAARRTRPGGNGVE